MTERNPEDTSGAFDRRSFMRKIAVGGFAIPVIASFKLDSLARAGTGASPNVHYPNQSGSNAGGERYPGQLFGNQPYPYVRPF